MDVILGCMRLATEGADDALASLVRLALERGVRDLDTARAYGASERVVARALADAGVDRRAVRVVTKCGMTRPDGAWVPDGRQRRILEDAEASAEALGAPADLLLLHAPDPAVPIATSARALAEAMERGLARGVGLSNVRRAELDAARAEAPISAIEIPLGAHDDVAARSGLARAALDAGVEVLAYAPFGGPTRSARLARDRAVVAVARELGVSAHRALLEYLASLPGSGGEKASLDERLRVVVGPRSPRTLLDCLSPCPALSADQRAALDERFAGLARMRAPGPTAGRAASAPRTDDAPQVIVAMGIAGAGKSSWTERWMREREAEGAAPVRLNRDTLGGTLKGIALRLDRALADGARAVVLDNTYIGRAERSDVLRVAGKRGARTRCVHFDTPLEDALHNVVLRMLARHGRLVDPREWSALAKSDPGLVRPTAMFRMARELEAPSIDEGFESVERVAFERAPTGGREALVVSVEALLDRADAAIRDAPPSTPLLLLAFRPDGAGEAWGAALEARVAAIRAARDDAGAGAVELAVCPHGGGPPICYCRPPLPGLVLAFAARHDVDPGRATFVTNVSAVRTLARRLRARVLEP